MSRDVQVIRFADGCNRPVADGCAECAAVQASHVMHYHCGRNTPGSKSRFITPTSQVMYDRIRVESHVPRAYHILLLIIALGRKFIVVFLFVITRPYYIQGLVIPRMPPRRLLRLRFRVVATRPWADSSFCIYW